MRYYSKKDWLVLLVVWVAIVLPLIFGFLAIQIESEPALVVSGWISLISAFLLLCSLSALSFPLYYEIGASVLCIRSGLLRQEIPLSSIQAIFPTRNPLVAAAWSFDRLQVNYHLGNRSLCALIAPQNKHDFLQRLAEQDSELEVKTDAVLRRQQ